MQWFDRPSVECRIFDIRSVSNQMSDFRHSIGHKSNVEYSTFDGGQYRIENRKESFCTLLIGSFVRVEAERCWTVFLCLRTAASDRIGRGFYIALLSATKNGSTTITPNAENYGECPDMPPRRRPDLIFTVPRLCIIFGGTSSLWCFMSCSNKVKQSQGIVIEWNWCVWAEHWRRNGHSSKRYTTNRIWQLSER